MLPPAEKAPSLTRLPAGALTALIEMKVVPMGLVVVGAQHDVEEPAGSVSDGAQERGLSGRPVPVLQNADLRAVSQGEARNVDGVGGRMLTPTPAVAVVEVAAGIRAEVLDAHDLLAEVLPRRCLQDVQLEQGPADRQGTRRREAVVKPDGGARHLNGIAEAATFPGDLIRNGRGLDRRALKDNPALLCVPLQTTQLVPCEPARLVPDVQRREGVESTWHDEDAFTNEQAEAGSSDQAGDQKPADYGADRS